MNTGSSAIASTSNAEAGSNSLQSISGDLWSRILDSVKGSRGVGTKQCIVLGAPNSGKSTLIRRISTTNGELAVNEETRQETLDLGMSYSVLEVKDEGSGDEETLARLSIYQLPSPSPPYPALLPLSLSKKSLLDSLVVIVLDWERPWSFVKELKEWIAMLEQVLKNEIGTDTFEMTEARERLETQLRNYQEPSPTINGSLPTTTTSTTAATIDVESPLPPGTLVNNLGLGIVVVCTKADHINTLEREREFTEEQFDYIQQTLRTVCLRYGASLFFTSQTIPSSFTKLRQYILHRIFSPSSLALNAASVPPTSTRAFPFQHRTNVIDRDQILVPMGWDSWGKIRILREKFDCEKVGEGWEEDLGRMRESQGDGQEGEGVGNRLQKEYEMVIVDFDSEDKPTNSSALVTPHDEQTFLQTHYAALQADLEKDPRLAFRQPANPSSSSTSSSAATGMRHGGVGPMAGSIGDLPNVQGALDRASGGGGGSTSQRGSENEASGRERERDRGSASGRSALGMSRQGSASASLPSRSPILSQSTNAPSSAVPSASTAGAAGSAAGGNQVLADFFQSLLTARSGSGSGTASPVGGGAAGGTGLRRPSENEKVTASNGEAK